MNSEKNVQNLDVSQHNSNEMLAAAIKLLNLRFVNLMETEARDVVLINDIETPCVLFMNKVKAIVCGALSFDGISVDMHPNPIFDDVGNLISRPLDINHALELLRFKNLVHFLKTETSGS